VVCREEERRALESGYNSNDEKGTADAHMDVDGAVRLKSSKKKSGKKRQRRQGAAEETEADGMADPGLGDDLEDAAEPTPKKQAVLESDDE
jgi:hypothetical protein